MSEIIWNEELSIRSVLLGVSDNLFPQFILVSQHSADIESLK